MFEVTKNNIRMIRGDTGSIKLDLTIDGVDTDEKLPISDEAYKATLSVKKNIDDVAYIMQKEFVNGEVSFTHEDTNNLPCGAYVYDVQIEILEDNSIHSLGYYSLNIIPDVTRE